MLHFLRHVLVLGVLGFALVACGQEPAPEATPATAPLTVPTAALSGPPDSACAAADVTARELVGRGLLDEAEALYKAVGGSAPDACVARGLAYVAVARVGKAADDKKTAENGDVTAVEAGKVWEGFLGKHVTPLQAPVLAGLAVLAVLLVVTRLLTPVLIGPTDVSHTPRRYTVLWWSGVVVLVGADALGVAAVSLPASIDLHPGGTAVLFLATGVGCLLVPAVAPRVPRAALGGVVVGGALALVSLALAGDLAVVTGALAAAVPAICLVAAARGHAARLVVEVHDATGATDDAAGRYVVNLLHRLGTQPPAGLRIPESTDVTSLSSDALSSVPEGALAKALFAVLEVVWLATPWRVVVAFPDSTTMTVQLQRNGRASPEAAATIACAALDPSGALTSDATEEGKDVRRRRLLVAAAAHILIELSNCHPELSRGLGGTTRPLSLALHAIATTRSPRLSVAERDALLVAAVADDPGSFLVQVAANGRLGRAATEEAQWACADETKKLLDRMPDRTEFLLLRLRLHYALAGARINRFLLKGNAECRKAAETAVQLLRKAVLDHPHPDPGVRELVSEIGECALLLEACLQRVVGHRADVPTIADAVRSDLAYARACCRAADPRLKWKAASAEVDDILRDLETAVTDLRLREWARVDPSLWWLRWGIPAARFVALVGEPPPTVLLDLPLFAEHRAALCTLGLDGPQDLLDTPTPLLTAATGAAPHVVRRWKDVAAMALPTASGCPALPIGLLAVVVGLDVHSRVQLRARVDDWPTWRAAVSVAMAPVSLVEPSRGEWRAYAWPALSSAVR